MDELIKALTQAGGIAAVTALFVWYLQHRDKVQKATSDRAHDAAGKLAESIGQLKDWIASSGPNTKGD